MHAVQRGMAAAGRAGGPRPRPARSGGGAAGSVDFAVGRVYPRDRPADGGAAIPMVIGYSSLTLTCR